MSEAALWRWLKSANSPSVFLWRVENSVSSGSPDVAGYIEGYGQVYFELKYSHPVGEDARPRTHARVSQEIWHCRLTELGSTCHFVLLQVGKERFLIPGSYTSQFNKMPLRDLRKFSVGGSSPTEIMQMLIKSLEK